MDVLLTKLGLCASASQPTSFGHQLESNTRYSPQSLYLFHSIGLPCEETRLPVESISQGHTSRMAAAGVGPGTGAAPRAARQVHVGRSDGRPYSAQEIISKSKTAANQIGDPIPEEWNQILDAETRRKMIQWKVVIGTGLSEELAWPKGESAWHNPPSLGAQPSADRDFQIHNTSWSSRNTTA